MAKTTYATIRANTQSTVHSIISSDATITSKGVKVLDGIPRDLIKNRASYIAVNTPRVNHPRMVISGTKSHCEVTVPIVISSRKESTTRELTDIVINALRDGQSTTRAVFIKNFKLISESTSNFDLEGKDSLYIVNIAVGYTFTG